MRVILEAPEAPRTLADIEQVLGGGDLAPPVRERALAIMRRLVAVEAILHQVPLAKAHLHEVGATDALVDVTGTLLGLHLLGVETVSASSPLPLGGGTVACQHGDYPVPAPATVRLLEGIPVIGVTGLLSLSSLIPIRIMPPRVLAMAAIVFSKFLGKSRL